MDWIEGHEKVTAHFGSWPSFHDAEVLSVSFERAGAADSTGPHVDIVVHAFEITNETTSDGFFKLVKHCLITFRLHEVSRYSFEEFNHQNVVFGLGFYDLRGDQLERIRFRMTMDASFGVSASFDCYSIEVVSVVPGEPDRKNKGSGLNI